VNKYFLLLIFHTSFIEYYKKLIYAYKNLLDKNIPKRIILILFIIGIQNTKRISAKKEIIQSFL